MKKLLWLIMILCLPISMTKKALAQEQVVEIMAPVEASGEVFMVAPEKIMILASFTGIVYGQDKQRFLDDLIVSCPAVQRIDKKSGISESTGHCTFTGIDPNDVIYSEWKCTDYLGECKGPFTITRGTGKFNGISGSSQISMRSALTETSQNQVSGTFVSGAVGLARWTDLKYKIPEKK